MTNLTRVAARQSARILPSLVLFQRVPTQKKAVALTFDDGPTEDTPALLAVLDELGLRATFFVIGQNVERYPHHARAIERHGHELATHGYRHRRIHELTNRELSDEIAKTERLLPPAWGRRPLFRPPWGEVSPRSLWVATSMGFTTALWSFDSLDSRGISARRMIERFSRHPLEAGDVVLFHEGEKATRQALPHIGRLILERGLTALPLSLFFAPSPDVSKEIRLIG